MFNPPAFDSDSLEERRERSIGKTSYFKRI